MLAALLTSTIFAFVISNFSLLVTALLKLMRLRISNCSNITHMIGKNLPDIKSISISLFINFLPTLMLMLHHNSVLLDCWWIMLFVIADIDLYIRKIPLEMQVIFCLGTILSSDFADENFLGALTVGFLFVILNILLPRLSGRKMKLAGAADGVMLYLTSLHFHFVDALYIFALFLVFWGIAGLFWKIKKEPGDSIPLAPVILFSAVTVQLLQLSGLFLR